MKVKALILTLVFAGLFTACDDDESLYTIKEFSEDEITGEEYGTLKKASDLPPLASNMKWVKQDNLSHEFSTGKTGTNFKNNWQDKFFNNWSGPAPYTRYTPARTTITNGKLVLDAKINGNTIQTGCISSKGTVKYPMFMQTRVKISNSVLSSAVWMLSKDSSEEIDNLEAYGAKEFPYFAKRLHLSHHTFIRKPFADYQPTGPDTWYYKNGDNWTDNYHVLGVLWTGPFKLQYFVDGELVRTVPKNEIDPKGYTNGKGLTKPEHIIISAAAQEWREGNTNFKYLTHPSVTNRERTKMYVDWIRVYKPVKK